MLFLFRNFCLDIYVCTYNIYYSLLAFKKFSKSNSTLTLNFSHQRNYRQPQPQPLNHPLVNDTFNIYGISNA